MTLAFTLSLALAAGMSIPAGALVSTRVSLRSICLRHEIDSFVSYFGGGALFDRCEARHGYLFGLPNGVSD